MYALYVKNKPVSDRLLAENGKFFQTKQAELGDKMDLASYLLKPVQRLGKYSLFLDGISRTNGPKSELIKARTIIQFQVRPKILMKVPILHLKRHVFGILLEFHSVANSRNQSNRLWSKHFPSITSTFTNSFITFELTLMSLIMTMASLIDL